MTVFVLNIHHKGTRGRQVPRFMKRIFFGIVAKVFFITLELGEDWSPSAKQSQSSKGVKGMVSNLGVFCKGECPCLFCDDKF